MTHTIEPERLVRIDAPRKHSPETQERLRQLLLSGAPARPDPKRAGFFEIEDRDQVFYVFIAQKTGKVTLLAMWSQAAEREAVPA